MCLVVKAPGHEEELECHSNAALGLIDEQIAIATSAGNAAALSSRKDISWKNSVSTTVLRRVFAGRSKPLRQSMTVMG